jgi:hypothetical protein
MRLLIEPTTRQASFALQGILDHITELLENRAFTSEIAGEDEGFLETAEDFFLRLQEQFTEREYIEEDPLLWREQQDAETD